MDNMPAAAPINGIKEALNSPMIISYKIKTNKQVNEQVNKQVNK
jgi:hypothetical protein